jgi:LDH2 family malate/lactate/ureidoglycolate dehydrogenase
MVDDIHSCSYCCTNPTCVAAQRDELREKFFSLSSSVKALGVYTHGRAETTRIPRRLLDQIVGGVK